MKKRLLSLILALSMAISLLPMTAFAIKVTPTVSLGTKDLVDAQHGSVYYGNWKQPSDDAGGYLTASILWKILDKDATCFVPAKGLTEEAFAQGDYYTLNGSDYTKAAVYDASTHYFVERQTLFLLSNQILDVKQFAPDSPPSWESSTIRSWLNGYDTLDSFLNSAFQSYEKGALADRAFANSAADKVFLLSYAEACNAAYGFDSDSNRSAGSSDYAGNILGDIPGNIWWLRDISASGEAYVVDVSGGIASWGANDSNIGVRPAVMIDLDAVLFSTAESYNNAASFTSILFGGGGPRKLTLWDGTEGFAAVMDNTNLTPAGDATVSVTDLGGGEDYTQISAMLLKGSGADDVNPDDDTVIYYGSIGTASTGDKTFDVPADVPIGSYTLRLFAENVVGGTKTDYAGSHVDIPVTVSYPTYSPGTKVKLTDGNEWIVLEDEGSGASRFTLVRDGSLASNPTFTRADADTALADYQTAAKATFGDEQALTRLPTKSEIETLPKVKDFSDPDTAYWLATRETDGYYQWAQGNTNFGAIEPAYYSLFNSEHAVRPVLTVLKSALDKFEPFISEQPEDIDFLSLDGDDAEFSVSATGMSLTYQWQVKVGENFSDIEGANGSTLVIPEENGLYVEGTTFRCELDSDWGTPVYTQAAALKTFDWAQYGEAYALSGTDFTISGDEITATVHTAAGLGFIASKVNDKYDLAGVTVVLDHDIDLTGRTFTPIGADGNVFSGHFDGGMHKISGLAVRGNTYCGLFGMAKNALIENLMIADGSVTADADDGFTTRYLGAVCGYGRETTLRNIGVGPVAVYGTENDVNDFTGGIVGYLPGEGTYDCVYNSYSRAVITGDDSEGSFAGGIVGSVRDDTVANCYFAGTISQVSSYTGAIAGLSRDTEISSCFWQTASGASCSYYGYNESHETVPLDTGCTALDASGLKTSATVTALNAWATAGNATEDPDIYEPWTVRADFNGGYPYLGTYTPPAPDHDRDRSTPARTITVAETSSPLFGGTKGAVKAAADMDNAFSASVEVKLTDSDEDGSSFSLGAGQKAYPFDISLYLKGSSTKVEPKDGYAVTISLPIPEDLLAEKEQLKIVHKGADGTVTTLASELKQIDGVWYLVFKATEFSPYALVLNGTKSYDEAAGLPYYLEGDAKTFIGFAADGKFLAPAGVTVQTAQNAKSFSDTAAHWAAPYIRFVTERELFAGTAENVFSPDDVMTRAMFATVLGRLYERSFGKVQSPDAVAFTDCDYMAYYGQYVNWATANGILTGYGNGLYGPNDPITREQMAAILYRYAQYLGLPQPDGTAASPFADAAAIPAYALPGANFCKGAGILTGREDGTFAPKDTATRAEVAASIERLVEFVLK